MNTDRIKEIQQTCAYPNSISVQQALLQVWNECAQEKEQVDDKPVTNNGAYFNHELSEMVKRACYAALEKHEVTMFTIADGKISGPDIDQIAYSVSFIFEQKL
jgi:hypothetical protein